ncbi:alpha-N-acetylglucosaminidase TIM-barrel domain-containing protein [Actinacidiphila rubida]|uniref:Alpha-N-acetylglucosaminidase n=1 Tax=Actinacidiphila rubida TaxID=310780 RepID=A0A1H8LI56_9ACTN|nr:alpha-N-acetylglucosaminidase TIM-barrel domain-containing protein [Actinacidiphila rubida]SEO04841.1 alpha-N-acetylglucosaminidase [Actinacidiphila rubida]
MSRRPSPPRAAGGTPALLGALLTVLAVLGALVAGSAVTAPGAVADMAGSAGPSPATFDTAPAAAAITRLIGPQLAAQVTLKGIDAGSAQDHYQIEADRGRVLISGTTPATLLAGFGTYLRTVAHADVSLDGDQLNLPRHLPLPTAPLAEAADVTHRFALNDTNEGYAGPYLDWAQMQRRIDVLAVDGINEVLVYEGQEAVYQQTFEQFGYSADEMRAWIPQPGHQPWWLLQNMCCQGSPISQQLIDRRAVLGRRMTGYLRQLGMTPVLPGYFGTVPPQFAQKNPGAEIVPQGTWSGFPRPDWLNPTTPLFDQVADTFYAQQTRMFGDSTMYKMDLLHEGGVAGDVNVGDASRAVQNALDRAHPGAIWAILGWQSNPRKETLEAVDRSRMLVLDGNSDTASAVDRDQDYLGTPYAFGTIWDFGGNSNMGAAMTVWNQKFHDWLARPGTALDGIAMMPEAVDNNPVAVAFFTGLAWRPAPVNLDDWMAAYATSRYGAADPHAIAAWQILGRSAYTWQPPSSGARYPTSLFAVQPSLLASQVALPYDPRDIQHALDELLRISPPLRNSTAYRHDVVDVARQVLANDTRTQLPLIRQAVSAHDLAGFEALASQWMTKLNLMDRLLAGDASTLFGAWQKDAESWAATPAEAKALAYDLRTLVTDWSDQHPIQDYARREWNGLVGDYYGTRWRMLFDALDKGLTSGDSAQPIDWHAVAADWNAKDTQYRSTPTGDAYGQAQQVAAYPAGHLGATADPKSVAPGGTVRVTATFTNDNILRATDPVQFRLTAPAGYTVTPVDGSSPAVAPGGTVTTAWDVAAPADAAPADFAHLTAAAHWTSGGFTDSVTATTDAVTTGPVGDPYRTASSAAVSFGQDGDTFTLAGGGGDVGATTDQYGTVYLPRSLASGQGVSTEVLDQDRSGPWARAGLVVRSDLSVPGSAGYADLAVTPDHGCDFMWDSDGNGTLDRYTTSGGFTAGGPVHLRITRDGDTVTGWCSQDGAGWVVVGSAPLPGAATAEDAGLMFTAANAGTQLLGAARFHGLTTAPFTARDTSGDTVLSLGAPTTALSAEAGSPPSAAVDGDHTNRTYWGSGMDSGETWWQVDLGAVHDLSSVNVRTYVDGKRAYTYTLSGSTDGVHWSALGGKNSTAAATDAGDTFTLTAAARYVRVTGLSNTANSSFHLSEVTVTGVPLP